MKIAIPLAGGKLCPHLDHCEQFILITVANGKITQQAIVNPPFHSPGVIPNWLADQGCTDVWVGTMGKSAQTILRHRGVQVMFDIPSETPETLVGMYLHGELT